MALEQSSTCIARVENLTPSDRLCSATHFLLHCFGSLHHLKMTKNIAFVLEDVRTFLLGMNPTTRIDAFTKLPSIMMDDLGFLKKNASAQLDLTIVTKEELLLLFVVCHLSLNGKSHFEKVVEDLSNRAPQVISMIVSLESTSGRQEYLGKYFQYFQFDDEGYLELDSTFFMGVKEHRKSTVPSSKPEEVLKCEDNTDLPKSVCPKNFTPDVSKLFNIPMPDARNGIELSEISSEKKTSCGLKNDKKVKLKKGSKQSDSCVNAIISPPEANAVKVSENSFPPKNVSSLIFLENTSSKNENIAHPFNVNTMLKISNRICTIVREGMVFLFEQFQCRLDMHLVCVVLHALHEAKRSFLWLFQHEQIALVEKILEPPWISGLENISGSFLKLSSHIYQLSEEQKRLLFISYVVAKFEKLHYSALLEMFEKHNMDQSELEQVDVYFKYKKDLFSVDESECIKFENFPPAKWMAESLLFITPVLYDSAGTSQGDEDIVIPFDQTEISKTVSKKSEKKPHTNKTDILNHGICLEKHSSGNGVSQHNTVDSAPHITDIICTTVREGMVFLFEQFQCRLNLHLVCVVLHALREAKSHFLLLFQSEQVAVVEKILEPVWVDGLEYISSFTFLKLSSYVLQLSEEQKKLLLISYAVGESEKLHCSALLKMFEKHNMDRSELEQVDVYFKYKKDLFSVDEAECIKFENFPPAKWMEKCLSPDSSSCSIDQSEIYRCSNDITIPSRHLSVDQTVISKTLSTGINNVRYTKKGIKYIDRTQTKNVSLNSQDAKYSPTTKLQDDSSLSPFPYDFIGTSQVDENIGIPLGITGISKTVSKNAVKEPPGKNTVKATKKGTKKNIKGTQKKNDPRHLQDSKDYLKAKLQDGSSLPPFPYDFIGTSQVTEDIGIALDVNRFSKTVSMNLVKEQYANKTNVLNHSQHLKERSSGNIKLQQNSVDTAPQIADRICKIVREGIVFLFEHFKCRLDMHLVCVVLHSLLEAKRPFMWLDQPEQIALVKKILEPLWVARVEDNSGTFLRPSLETFELSKDQRNLLFISYAVGQSKKLQLSTLLDMLKMHKMDLTELKEIGTYFKCKEEFFYIDGNECIKYKKFPPAHWMAETLLTSFPSELSRAFVDQSRTSEMGNNIEITFGDLSLGGTGISTTLPTDKNAVTESDVKKCTKETVKDVNVSLYSQETLDYLTARLHDGIAYLLQFFELNIYSGLLEVVLHVKKDCSVFFGLPIQQQVEVIRASFQTFFIDVHGRVILFPSMKHTKFKLNKSEKCLLCMSYIISQKCVLSRTIMVHYRELFSIYHSYNIEKPKHFKDLDQYEFFRKREDVFRVTNTGFVGLGNVSYIKFNYISILMSDRNTSPVFVNTGTVIPGMNFGPNIFNPGAVIPGINYRPPVFYKNPPVTQMIWNPIGFNTGAVMQMINFVPMNPSDTRDITPNVNCNSIKHRTVENNQKRNTPKAQSKAPAAKSKIVIKKENVIEITDSLTQNKKGFITEPVTSDETKILNVLDNMNEAKRVKYAVLYLSQSFVLQADDLTLIFCVLEDVKSYLFKLSLQDRDDFVNNCVPYLLVNSSDPVSSTEIMSDSCILSDEEKIALFVALLLSREKELHFTKMFDQIPECNTTNLACVKSALDQYEFVARWKHVFSMSPDGKVKLLPILMKNSEISSSNSVFQNTNTTNPSVNESGFKFETKDSRKCFFERNSTASISNLPEQLIDNKASVISPVTSESTTNSNMAADYGCTKNLSNDETSAVSSITSTSTAYSCIASDCRCAKDVTTKFRTVNFFIIILSESKIGFSVSVLMEKLLLASEEVQHYISCIYKNDILNFFQNNEEFYISPTSGNVCCKTSK